MRVIFLTHNYPRFPGDLAGAFLHPLAVALTERGHAVTVVAPSDHGKGGRETIDGVAINRVRYARPARERYAYTGKMTELLLSPAGWMALAGLLRSLREAARLEAAGTDAAVVHAHWWIPGGLAAPAELPCVVTLHGTDARLLARVPGARFLASRAFLPGRVITAVSRAVAVTTRDATGRTIDDAHVSAMPALGTPRVSRGGRGVVLVGRLTAQKRAHLLLEALALMPGARPALTIVGDGPERAALESRARQLGLGELVRFAGQVAPESVGRFLDDADAFVLPAVREGFGLAAVEALLAGVPVVVCRDGGGLLDVVATPGAGVAVEPTPEAIAEAIQGTIADPNARSRAHAAGLEWNRTLSPDRVAERCEGWYQEAIVGHR